MSRDFYLRCVTCNPPTEPDAPAGWGLDCDLDWQGDNLLALLPKMQAAADLFLATGMDIDPDSIELYGSTIPHGLGAFSAEHVGHDVQVWDEYGRRWTGQPETTAPSSPVKPPPSRSMLSDLIENVVLDSACPPDRVYLVRRGPIVEHDDGRRAVVVALLDNATEER